LAVPFWSSKVQQRPHRDARRGACKDNQKQGGILFHEPNTEEH